MSPQSRFFLATLLAFAWSGLAMAETPDPSLNIEMDAFKSVTEMQLDDAFEKSAEVGQEKFLAPLPGPTSMDCTNPILLNSFETCVVTAAGTPRPVMPAALAQQ